MLRFILFFLFFLSYFLLSQPRLVLVFEYSRHGARSPENFHNSEIFPEGQKKITAEGLYQHFLIGSEMRYRYVQAQKFLPEKITPNSLDIKVYASSLVRTFSSAVSQLLGLYPDNSGPEVSIDDLNRILPPFNMSFDTQKNFNLTKINIASEVKYAFRANKTPATLHGIGILMINQIHAREDLFFQGYEKAFCPKISKMIKKLQESPKNQKILAEWRQNLFPILAEVLQKDWNTTLNPLEMTFESVKDIYDLWASLAFHQRGYELHFPNDQILEELKAAYIYVMYFMYYEYPLSLKAAISLLVEDIVLKMSMKVNNSTIPEFKELKFAFYSGRDRQINALLVALMEPEDIKDLSERGVVFFASVFLIELHEEDGRWFVKVWFNDEEIKMKCGEVRGICELGRFLDVIKTVVSDNIYRDCGTENYRFTLE